MKKKKLNMSIKTLIALALGVVAGLLLQDYKEEAKTYIGPFGTLFLNCIKMIVVPMVFSSIIVGICGIGDAKKVPLLYTASWICEHQNGWNFREASAIEQVKKCNKPMFFIHGDKDDFVPTYMVNEVYAAKSEPKEIWLVPETDHATSYKNYPEEYTKRVKAFTEKYIN